MFVKNKIHNTNKWAWDRERLLPVKDIPKMRIHAINYHVYGM